MTAKLKSIIKGWSNYINPDPNVEAVAMERAKICSECNHSKNGWYAYFMEDEVTEIKGMVCGLCSCPLSTLLRSRDEKCKIDLW